MERSGQQDHWRFPMILGIGADLANIERIQGTMDRFGDRFIQRIFTPREQAKAGSRPMAVAATYAKRWAAKEACSKALGTGLRMGISWKDMAVSNLRSGQSERGGGGERAGAEEGRTGGVVSGEHACMGCCRSRRAGHLVPQL